MKEIVSYKFFTNAEDFENWQIDESRAIMQIIPSPNGVSFKEDTAMCSENSEIGIFVTFFKTVEVS